MEQSLIDALAKIEITEFKCPALYNKACAVYVAYQDKLVAALTALSKAGATPDTHPKLYEAVILMARYAGKLPTAFTALKKAGVTPDSHPKLYEAGIRYARYANQLPNAFTALKEAGATLDKHPKLYAAVIPTADNADKLPTAFTVLKEAGATPDTQPKLYEAVIENACDADKLENAFTVLKEAGATLDKHPKLYAAVIPRADNADKLPTAFTVLKEAGATLDKRPKLYAAVIQEACDANQLKTACTVLKEAGATLDKHPKLYAAVIPRARYADMLPAAFEALKEAGATPDSHPKLYEAVIIEAYSADKLATALTALTEAGATLDKHPKLYEAVIQKAYFADMLPTAFSALKEAGATPDKYPTLYEAIIPMARYANKLPTGFAALKEAGATPDKHPKLYEAVTKEAYFADRLPTVFEALKEAGATPDKHPKLYEAVIKKANYADELATALTALTEAGATFDKHPKLYEAVIQKAGYTDELPTVFAALTKANITVETHPEFYQTAINKIDTYFMKCLDKIGELNLDITQHPTIIESIIQSNPTITLEALKWIEYNKFDINTHQYLFEAMFSGSEPLINTPYLLAKVQSAIDTYFKENERLSIDDDFYASQCFEVQSLIASVTQDEASLTQGPLNKSKETRRLEELLARISQESIENIEISFDQSLGYVLQFKDEPEIYLSELLRQVNFNHIELSSEQVEGIGACIKKVANDFESTKLGRNLIVKQLPKAAGHALDHYVGDKCYKNINRLFRGVQLNTEKRYSWLEPVDGKESLLANFLTGCLVNWAAAELPRTLLYSEERQLLERIFKDIEHSPNEIANMLKNDEPAYNALLSQQLAVKTITQKEYDKAKALFGELSVLFPSYGLVDRGENIKNAEQGGELAIGLRRTANPVHAPSVTSLSVHDSGSPCFQEKDTVRTKIETDNSTRPVINETEGEILVPAGASYIYTSNLRGGFFAREVNSPGITPSGSTWSATAIATAYRDHLSKSYKDTNHHTTVNDITIQRPNHGLAHEYRIATYIDVIINYFAHHAKDETFKLFCQNISPEEREWLQVAAAYSITGRESEISAGENLKRYNQFREASQKHMEAFLEKYPPPSDNPEMRERMLHIVRWMGNPAYENEFERNQAINAHQDPNEREHRNFIHRILTIAHKLDLPRCYAPQQFKAAMGKCLELSEPSDSQQNDYEHMIRYAVDLNRAHGNALRTDISLSGELIACSENYREPFDKASTNLRQVRELTESIPRPPIAEQYQFPKCENEELKARVLEMCGIPYEPSAKGSGPK